MNLTKTTNWRLIVYPYEPFSGDFRAAVKQLEADILRHVDGIQKIDWGYDTICTFCGSNWETEQSRNDPDIPYGQPLCCEEARKEWENSQNRITVNNQPGRDRKE